MGDWICPRCKWVNRGFADRCLGCGDARDGNATEVPAAVEPQAPTTPYTSETSWTPSSTFSPIAPADPYTGSQGTPLMGAPGTPLMAASGSMMAPAIPMTPQAPATPAGAAELATGLVAGLLAAAVSAGVWYAVVVFSNIQFGLLAAGIGWLVGTATVFGAGGRGSLVLAAGSTVFTLAALAVSEYLIIFHFATEEFGIAMDVIQPLDVMIDLVATSLSVDPITLLFWGIAVVTAAWIPFRAINNPS